MTGSDKHNPDALWFSVLTGEDDSMPGDDREAAALQKAIKSEHAAELKAMDVGNELALKRLLKRCEREGLLQTAAKPWWRRPVVPGLMAIAATILLTVNVLVDREESILPGDQVRYRGLDASGAAILNVASPQLAAGGFQSELAALGVTALVFQLNDEWQLQAELEEPLSDALKETLDQYALPVPEAGRLRLRFQQAGQP